MCLVFVCIKPVINFAINTYIRKKEGRKCMNKKSIFIYCSVIILIFSFCVFITENDYEDSIETNAGTALSNKKIGWGIKREKDNKQPDLGKVNAELINKYEGYCMGNSGKKYIYITFDEGYEAGYTEKILDTLKENNVKATFFITAHYLNTNEELVKRMIDEGHIVGNHTVNHKSMPDISNEEIKKEVMDLHLAIYEKFGYEMKYIRPPKGEYSERTLNECNTLGYKTVMWSFAYKDWEENNQSGEENAKKMIINNFHNGEIMLLHGNSKDNCNVLGNIIQEAKNEGYEIRSLDEFEK